MFCKTDLRKSGILGMILLLCSGMMGLGEERKSEVSQWEILPTPVVTREEPARQRAVWTVETSREMKNVSLEVYAGETLLERQVLGDLKLGANSGNVFLPVPTETVDSRWILKSTEGNVLAEKTFPWEKPRHWTLYVVSSTHTDIGLHNSQYIQRKMSSDYIDMAKKLVDETANWPDASRYRYMMEGTWFWGNYEQDRSESAAWDVVRNDIQKKNLGVGATCAGNHTQVYGLEQLCRSAYTKQQLHDRWGLDVDTMMMSDNNGMIWSLVVPYVEAGIQNILFCPNQWNPLPSTIWPMKELPGKYWNPEAGGGGSRVDVRWDSPLPMVFWWEGADEKSRVLVWCSTQYGFGGHAFGLERGVPKQNIERIATVTGKHLRKMEQRYPYDVWVFAHYEDDESPNTRVATMAREWNEKYRWPEFRTVGDLSEPFQKLRENFAEQIPTLRGDMTSGWSQHPICAPELLAQKFAADRLLPTAEKLATLARIYDPSYIYPTTQFRRAWEMLICNDEHSYGTSGYQGRRVYETWLQHRDWIDKAEETAENESRRALETLSRQISTKEESIVLFNPTLIPRKERVEVKLEDGRKGFFQTPEVPSFGYVTVPVKTLKLEEKGTPQTVSEVPTLENAFYRLVFAPDGSIASLFDKELQRELLDPNAEYRANQFLYTQNNHKTFTSPPKAVFEKVVSPWGETVIARMDDPVSKAAIVQEVTLRNDEKRIEIDNRMSHVRDMFNQKRYYRYGYYAFPFAVPDFQFHAQLNGCIAQPKKDVTGHGTDVYLATRDFVSVNNQDFGVSLIQVDSHLVEFGKISPDKTDFGKPLASSHLYSYLFTDWLQMHTPGSSYIEPRFRYVITSHRGDFRQARISQLAERVMHPILTTTVKPQSGKLPPIKSFLKTDVSNVRLLTLKPSEKPGKGYILRFQETDGMSVASLRPENTLFAGRKRQFTRCTVTEQPLEKLLSLEFPLEKFGYGTIRMETFGNPLVAPMPKVTTVTDHSVELTWQAVGNAAQYAIYRGTFAEFQPDEYHLVGMVTQPSWMDENLGPKETYFYRVQAISPCGRVGAVSEVLQTQTTAGNSPPAPIGSVYTGLVTVPKAVHGEKPDQLYLEWGQNQEADLSHYELYRSETSGFTPDESTFVAKVEPGSYRVGRYEDLGLKVHTRYYYRVCAVDKDGNKSDFSEEFSAVTREPYDPA